MNKTLQYMTMRK